MAIRISGINSGLDTDSIVTELVSAYRLKTEKYTKAQTKLSWKQDAWKTLNSKIYKFYNSVSSMRYNSAYTSKTASVSDTTKATVTASTGAVNGTQTLEVSKLAKAGYLTGTQLGSTITSNSTLSDLGYTGGSTSLDLTTGGKTTGITIDSSTTISSVVSQLKSAGVNASFDSTNQRIFIAASDTGAANDFTLTASDADGTSALSSLGLTGGTRVAGQDAKIVLNGATFTSASNQFSVNGLTINALAETTGEISITTADDTKGLYDTVKNFITSYNELMNEMTSLYNASSAKGYEPLTDDEKESMTDTQIEEWEEKIKDSLFRRDDTLFGVMNTMKSAMFSSFTDSNGNKLSLSSFGISTLGVLRADANEENAFHIDGDSSDTATSGNADKLLAAINANPDQVVDFMKQLSTELYSNLDTKMKSSSLKSVYNVYNDKQMAKEYSDYTTTITKWEEKLTSLEDYYYAKFTAMETALAKLNSQQSALSSLLGS